MKVIKEIENIESIINRGDTAYNFVSVAVTILYSRSVLLPRTQF